jgi:hypothetical protein
MFQSQNVNPYRCDSILSHDDHENVKCSSLRVIVLTKVCMHQTILREKWKSLEYVYVRHIRQI